MLKNTPAGAYSTRQEHAANITLIKMKRTIESIRQKGRAKTSLGNLRDSSLQIKFQRFIEASVN